MRAAFSSLALACLLFLSQGTGASAASMTNSPMNYAGAPLSARIQKDDNESLNYATTLNEMAYQLILNGSYKEAEGRLRQSLSFDPELICAQCNLGYILNKTGRPSEALPHLLYAYKLAPNEPAVLQSLAASYQLCGNYLTAINLYEQYCRLFPHASDSSYIAGIAQHLEAELAQIDSSNNHIAHSTPSEYLSWKKKNIKVYVQSGRGLKGFQPCYDEILLESFQKWSQAGVLSFEFVSSPSAADIECEWTDDLGKLSSRGEGGEALLQRRGDTLCHARVTLLTTGEGLHSRLTQSDVRTLCLHEVGHALGIMKHSAHPDDVMFSTLAFAANPSARDIGNLKSHYH